MTHMNWLHTPVSMVDSVRSMHPRTITLASWVSAVKVSNVDHIPKKQRPAVMPHGMFMRGRKADNLVRSSGLMQFDVDERDNPGLNVDEVKRRAASDPAILFVAKSAGAGCWGLVRRDGDEDAQLDHIQRVLQVTLDRCNSRSVAALRFAAHDPAPYLSE